MAYDSFSSRIMLQAIEQMQPRATFLTNLFFPRVEVKQGQYADVDVINQKPKVAQYSNLNDEATLVEKSTRSLKSVKIPNIAVKVRLTPQDLLKRPVGMTQYDGLVSEADEINRQIKYLTDLVYRAIEVQAADIIEDGVATLTGSGISDTITFGRDAALTYTIGTAKWDNASGNPLGDLQAACALIQEKSGMIPSFCVMGTDALAAFMGNADVQAQFNSLNSMYGTIKPEIQGSDGAAWLAKIMVPGFHLDCYSYPIKYLNSSDVSTAFVSAKKVFIGCGQAPNYQVYGAIMDADAGLQAAQFYPKIWKEQDPSCYYIAVKSSPLCMLAQPDSTACIQVLS